MTISLSHSQQNKIALIFFLMAITVPMLLFDGTLDDFIPKHIAKVEETSLYGGLIEKENKVIQLPGFYILGAVITLISGLASEKLISFPIQLIPYAVLFFTVLYKISGSSIIASLITLIQLSSGTTGTSKIFFWPHGIGFILFFSVLLLAFILMKQDLLSKPLILLAAITGSSLVYVSYDYTATTLILLATLLMVLMLFYLASLKHHNGDSRHYLSLLKTFFILLLILSIIELGLSEFVYGVFIPTLQVAQDFEINGLEKVLISYFNPELSTTSLSQLMIHYPITISLISIAKYISLVITILLFCIFTGVISFKGKSLGISDLCTFAILLMQGLYAVPRFFIGAIVVTYLWLPGIFCAARLSQMPRRFKQWAFVALTIIILCNSFYYWTMENNNFINHDEYEFGSYKAPAQWFLKTNDGGIVASDELTKNFFILYTTTSLRDQKYSSFDCDTISQQYEVLSSESALTLVRLSEGNLNEKYYILNKKSNLMSLDNWVTIKSWRYFKEQIDGNDRVNKIYDVSLLATYYSS